eukprot:TRINITY_DN58436_c0_g1_i1.p1 TRINITY_DN58436_c0_g1~~TRINITY_DN58436_c0_g1_i1.p1  ORF type:complete len:171 (-),score=47.38 TRINITY_DN58436_c0_g1_i1:17-529(-)
MGDIKLSPHEAAYIKAHKDELRGYKGFDLVIEARMRFLELSTEERIKLVPDWLDEVPRPSTEEDIMLSSLVPEVPDADPVLSRRHELALPEVAAPPAPELPVEPDAEPAATEMPEQRRVDEAQGPSSPQHEFAVSVLGPVAPGGDDLTDSKATQDQDVRNLLERAGHERK